MRQIRYIFFLCFLAISCGTDELVVNNSSQENIVGNSLLVEKLLRVSQYHTTVDNVIDNTSCFAIQFPFTAIANGHTVNLNDEADYQVVKDILDADDSDEDIVSIQFPVSVSYADYSQAAFATETQFDEAVANCTGTIELACMGFNFPLDIKSYRSHDRLAQTIGVTSNKGLFEFMKSLLDYDAVSFDYPIDFTIPGGSMVSIENNSQLLTTIDSYSAECGTDTDPVPGSFEEIIIQGTWYVSYFFRDSDQTNDYEEFDFTFNTNGTVTVIGGGSPGSGTWISYIDSGDLTAEFTFASSALEELEEDWTVTEYTTTLIKMEHVSGGGEEIRYFHLAKN